jgi:hypothetical protein
MVLVRNIMIRKTLSLMYLLELFPCGLTTSIGIGGFGPWLEICSTWTIIGSCIETNAVCCLLWCQKLITQPICPMNGVNFRHSAIFAGVLRQWAYLLQSKNQSLLIPESLLSTYVEWRTPPGWGYGISLVSKSAVAWIRLDLYWCNSWMWTITNHVDWLTRRLYNSCVAKIPVELIFTVEQMDVSCFPEICDGHTSPEYGTIYTGLGI